MNWYLVAKVWGDNPEYRLGRFTDTARRNIRRKGCIKRWSLRPTDRTITEHIRYDHWSIAARPH